MPETRLRRMRAAYPEWNPLDRQAEVNRIYDSVLAKHLLARGCVCNDSDRLPVGRMVRCPLHPSRTVCRGPVGQTN